MLLNCGVWVDSSESLGLQGDPTSTSWRRSVLCVHWRDWCLSWNSNSLTTWCGELTHLKRPWCWERLRAGAEGGDRGWMASPTQWTWVWVDSRSWWWPGRPGALQFMESQIVGHDWATELNCLIIPIRMITVSLLLLTNSSVDFVLHYFQFLCTSPDFFVCCTCCVSVSFIFSLLQV